MQDCIFCKIINKEVPSDVIYEDEDFIVFKDINPFGPVALLVVPKKHIPTIIDVGEKEGLVGALLEIGIEMVEKFNLDEKGFAFHINGGGVQEVNHLHLKIGGDWEDKSAKGFPKW